MAKKKQAAAQVAGDATEASVPAAAHAPGVTISDARKAELQAMLTPEATFTPDVDEAMRERGITPADVLEAIKTGTSRRHI